MTLNKNIYRIFSALLCFTSITGYITRLFILYNNFVYFIEWELVLFNRTTVVISIILDWIRVVFLSSVFLIAGSISKFSEYYIAEDKDYTRFMLLLVSFVFSMVLLIISPNLIRILLGWDGLGLTSYALVIYYQNESSCSAGILTVLSNRIGDVCILMSIGLIFFKGSWNFIFFERGELELLVVFLVVLAGITKRAQIPFSAWLPAAMAAPTPVSALVHSSTLVTAGVYLLIRFYPCIEDTLTTYFLFLISIMTILISGWGANFEVDIKKIIALSTLSQLGLIIIILSIGMPALAFFHLITHAMFKSTLFICGGVIIHISDGSQDSRFISTLSSSSPLLMGIFCLTNLALLGFPFLAGYFSKDLVLEYFFINSFSPFLLFLVILATGLTVSYRLRAIFLCMNRVNNLKRVRELIDNNNILVLCMRALVQFRVWLGFVFSWSYDWVRVPMVLAFSSKYFILSVCALRGLFMTHYFYSLINFKLRTKRLIGSASRRMLFLPFFSTKNLNKTSLNAGSLSLSTFDAGWLEFYGPRGGKTYFLDTRLIMQKAQKSVIVSSYLLSILTFIFFWLLII